MHKLFSAATAAALALTMASPVQAQFSIQPTGSQPVDPFWEISCVASPGITPGSACESGWTAADRITVDPRGWADVPTADGAYYIGVAPNGVAGGDIVGEAENYTYTFRTSFDLGGFTGPVTVNLSTFLLDNYWKGWSFDGVNFNSAGISPTPLPAEGRNWETPFQLTAQGTYSDYFYIQITGNGRNDGILAAGTVSVPEPGVFGLLLAGLMGLGVAGVRRRASLI